MTKRSQHPFLLSDQRGAAMFMGVFFAVFLVGAAYYVLGVGEAVIHRQRMQDAADSGAFAAAVLHARGMNIIALINTMMAALLSVLVLLKLMEALLTIAILALSVAAFFTAGSTSGLIAPLTRVRNIVQQIESKARPIVNRGLNALHWGSKSVRVLMPAAAELRVVDTVVHEYSDVAYFGFALPMSLTLPVVPDKFSVVCGEAGKIVGDLATLPVSGIAPKQVLDAVGKAAKALTQSLQAYFCGGGTGEPPPSFEPPDQNIQLPKLASRAACEDNQEPKHANDLCRQAAIDEAQGEPFGFRPDESPRFDTPPGECRPGPVKYAEPLDGFVSKKDDLSFRNADRDCGKYQQWVATAASQCNPYAESNPYHDDVSNFIWQEATKEDWWKFIETPNGFTWEKQTPPNPEAYFKAQHVVRGEDLPKYCNNTNYDPTRDALCVSPKQDWLVICPDAKALDGTPLLCHPSALKPLPKEAQPGSMLMMSYPVVRRLLGCEGKMKVEAVKLNVKPGGGITNQEKKSSFKLADDALLGEDIFQLRVVVLGKDIGEAGMNRVKVALYGAQDAHADVLNQLRHVGQLSVAQAEYFTTEADGKNQEEVEERRQWMWTPHWRARLRRIWIPTDFSHAEKSGNDPDLTSMSKNSQVSTSIEQSCQKAKGSSGKTVDTSQCAKSDKPGGLSGFVRGLSEIFIH